MILTDGGALVMAESAPMVDAQLPMYQRVGGIAGNLNSIGSDTLNNLMTFWAEGFAKEYPNVKIPGPGAYITGRFG